MMEVIVMGFALFPVVVVAIVVVVVIVVVIVAFSIVEQSQKDMVDREL